ncbi:MAG: YggT family protein [Tepidanaerobacteraceae bacterium]
MVNLLFQFIYFMITLRIILSFFPNPINPSITRIIYQTTEPILAPFRSFLQIFIPKGHGFYLDFSPMLALLFLNFLRGIVIRSLMMILW